MKQIGQFYIFMPLKWKKGQKEKPLLKPTMSQLELSYIRKIYAGEACCS